MVASRRVAGGVRLEPVLSSVADARSLVSSVVARAGLPDGPADDAQLVISELVTNAVLHARTTLDVAVLVEGGTVRVEVTDSSPDPVVLAPSPPAPAPLDVEDLWDDGDDIDLDAIIGSLATTGRGMELVGALCRAWGVAAHDGGKTVWADVGPDADPGAPGLAGGAPADGLPADGLPADGVAASAPAAAVGGPAGDGGPAPSPGPPAVGVMVRFVAVPVRLILESDRQLADALRELQVMALAESCSQGMADLAARATEAHDSLRRLRLSEHPDVRVAVARGDRLVDVHIDLTAVVLEQMAHLEGVLRRIEAARRGRHLLALGPSDEVVSFRRWHRDEITRQLAGERLVPSPFLVVPLEGSVASSRPLGGRRAELLRRLADDIAVAPDRQEVAEAATRRIRDELRPSFVNLFDLDVEVGELRSLARVGFDEGYPLDRRFDLAADNPTSEVVRTGTAIKLRTVEERLERYAHLRLPPAAEASPTIVWVPLGRGVPAAGAIAVGFSRSRDFSDADVVWLVEVGLAIADRMAEVA